MMIKDRVGNVNVRFDSAEVFAELLPLFAKHAVDLLTVHGRTVKEMYRSEVHYEYIARAAAELSCPVLANGNIYSAQKGAEVLKLTGARGLMIGRSAIRIRGSFSRRASIFGASRGSCRGDARCWPT